MPTHYHNVECGLLPLRHRFVRLTVGKTVWIVKASRVVTLAARYYDQEGWDDELEPGESQPRGRELRGLVEVNTELTWFAKECRLSQLGARLVSGPRVKPPHDDYCWWFEEQGGEVEEVTDLPIDDQKPYGPLWFSTEWGELHGAFSTGGTP